MLAPISEARQKLFQLFELAVRLEGKKIVIGRRGQPSQAVLVSARYLERLEAAAKPRPAAPRAAPESTARKPRFHMGGTLEIIGHPDTVISEVRERQAKLCKEKEKGWEKIEAELRK